MTTEMVDRNESAAESFSFRNGIKVFLFDGKKRAKSEVRNIGREQFRGKKAGKWVRRIDRWIFWNNLFTDRSRKRWTCDRWITNINESSLSDPMEYFFRFFSGMETRIVFCGGKKTGNSLTEFVCHFNALISKRQQLQGLLLHHHLGYFLQLNRFNFVAFVLPFVLSFRLTTANDGWTGHGTFLCVLDIFFAVRR